MSERKLGGSYPCRICGCSHGCVPCNQKALPLQKVQIAIEDLENFFTNSLLLTGERKSLEGLLKELRTLIGVPREKIYSRRSLLGEEELSIVFEKALGGEKLKETKKETFEYNPTGEILERASPLISRICDFALKNVHMTKAQEELMMVAILSLKKNVLKK